MNRRDFLALMAAGSSMAYTCTHRAPAAALQRNRPPNVIFVFSDEQRWHASSIGQMPEMHTPNHERLAREGMDFTHCISNYPVCSPYRGILMSGRWPYQNGVIDNNIPLDSADMTLGKAFKQAGYDTGYIGKWHLGGTRAEPFGFDPSLIWTNLHQNFDGGVYHPADGGPVNPKGYNATLMTDQALEYIDAHRSAPFFLMLSLHPPHSNFLDAPEKHVARYPEGSLRWRPNVPEAIQNTQPDEAAGSIWEHNTWPYYRGYHAHVSAVDEEVGRLIDALDAWNLSENTLFVYTSDHGSMFGSHGIGSKRQPYDESVRVPFLARWPGVVPAGERVDALLGTIDIMPTLCAAAGIPVPDLCEGQDFSPWLRGERGPSPESQFIMHIAKDNASGGQSHPAPVFRGVRTSSHTYAICGDGSGYLFDNGSDPYQMDNQFAGEAPAALQRRLHDLTRSWLPRAHDPFDMP